MATIFGALNIRDRDTVGDARFQVPVYNTVNDYLAATEAEANKFYAVFVDPTPVTDQFIFNYKLPMSGMLQAARNLSRPGAVKATGSWDAAVPIEDGRDQIAGDDVAMAYLTAEEMDRQVKGVAQRYVNWKRFLVLRALLNATNDSVADDVTQTTLTIRRLANADGTTYPPLLGTSTETTGHNHYVGTNYASSSISDTNNPFVTIRDALEEHFGDGTMVAFINNAERAKVEALTAFARRTPAATVAADNATQLDENGLPVVPGRIIGAVNDVIVSEWRWVPSGYILAVSLSQPAPLKQRLDIPETLRGFKLVAKQTEYPLEESFYRAREGYGVGNRLNGVAVQLVASTSYATPTGY